MTSGRLEAFTDGVIAILVTIMVLDLRPPDGGHLGDLRPLVPKLLVYLLSFVFVAIYWNNHHHLMQIVERVDGRVLWANMHLLFWLSLTPVGTAWMGPHVRQTAPVAVYGVILLGAAVAFFILTRVLLTLHPPASALAVALGRDWKGKLSGLAYLAAIPLALVSSWVALAIYIAVALVWLAPDRRIERASAALLTGPAGSTSETQT